jgi:hypothetical protein
MHGSSANPLLARADAVLEEAERLRIERLWLAAWADSMHGRAEQNAAFRSGLTNRHAAELESLRTILSNWKTKG